MIFSDHRPGALRAAVVCGALLLGGCATLPASGPTASEVVRNTAAERNTLGMRLVDVDGTVLTRVAALDAQLGTTTPTFASLARPGRNDVVGPGDELDISVFEVGASLFGAARASAEGYDPSAQAQRFPPVSVDQSGRIRLPYAGVMHVAGKTPAEIATMIERAYTGKSQMPQVAVAIRTNLSETVYVSGDVRKPGRQPLTLQGERLLDAIANGGGAVAQTQDMIVRLTRDGRSIEQRLDRVRAGSPDDVVLVAGDRVELIRRPQTYVVLGAANRVAQVPFDQSDVTLAEAVARVGGPNDATANPRAVFVFRYEQPDAVPADTTAPVVPVPTIYRLNMLAPESYFVAQRFAMRDKDVLYVSNAGINRTAKFVAIINQLFSPFVAVRTVTGN